MTSLELLKKCIAEIIVEPMVNEEAQPEPYDDEADTFAPGPRDRMEPSKKSKDDSKDSPSQDNAAKKPADSSMDFLNSLGMGQQPVQNPQPYNLNPTILLFKPNDPNPTVPKYLNPKTLTPKL